MSTLIYHFEGIELDTGTREIRVGADRKDVSPLVLETLAFLAKNSDRVVSKEQLANELWTDRVVTDSSISQAIRKARTALQECGVDPSVIKTQHGHGFRLDTDVVVVEKGQTDSSTATLVSQVAHWHGWKQRRPMTALAIAVLGGLLITAANITEILDFFSPDPSLDLLEETQSTLQTTDAKVDEIVRLLREQTALSGSSLDTSAEETIRDAIRTMVESGDARKQNAISRLEEGDVDGAAAAIATVAREFDEASEASRKAAAESWREAGAIYYSSNVPESVRSYEAAMRLEPENPINAMDLGFAYLRAGRVDDAIATFEEAGTLSLVPAARAQVERGLGIAYRLKGEYAVATTHLVSALEIADNNGDIRQMAKTLMQLGLIARTQGDNETARQRLEAAVTYAEESGDEAALADALNDLGIIMASTEQYDDAAATFQRTYDIYLARNDLAGQSQAIGNLGATALTLGNLDEAESWLLRSVELGERLGAPRSITLDLMNLASISAQRGDFEQAAARNDRARVLATESGLEELRLIILVNSGEVARDAGDETTACRLWAEALPPLRAMEHYAAEIVVESRQSLDCPEPDPAEL